MSEPFIGQIQIFPYNFAPRGWAFCNGQIMSIAQNTALFSLLGTTYGGNGQTTFALPDLRGRAPISAGQGPGLASYVLGQVAGTESTTLTTNNLPAHNHTTSSFCNNSEGGSSTPANSYLGKTGGDAIYAPAHDNTSMGPMPATGMTGGNQPVGILPPFLVLNYCIALQGIFPSRN